MRALVYSHLHGRLFGGRTGARFPRAGVLVDVRPACAAGVRLRRSYLGWCGCRFTSDYWWGINLIASVLIVLALLPIYRGLLRTVDANRWGEIADISEIGHISDASREPSPVTQGSESAAAPRPRALPAHCKSRECGDTSGRGDEPPRDRRNRRPPPDAECARCGRNRCRNCAPRCCGNSGSRMAGGTGRHRRRTYRTSAAQGG